MQTVPNLDSSNLYGLLGEFHRFKETISSCTEESFRKVYESACANKYGNIVYVLQAERSFKRLKGESNVIYIGQTKRTLKARYAPYAKHHATSTANKLKFEHIIDNYGPISVLVSDFSRFGSSLSGAEGQLLWWYFQNHCEYPPINYSKTRVRSNSPVV